MLLSRWFRRSKRATRAFRPAVLLLEDRTVPSAATHLAVIAPESVQSGQPAPVVVEALDASNHLASGFTDQVALSLGTADAGAKLPGPYTFTGHGPAIHVFQVTLAAAGPQTIIATDTTNSAVTSGSAGTTVNPPPVATSVTVVTPEQAAVGVPAPVTVEVLDQSGHPLRNFTGTVTFTSTDPAATASATRKGQTLLSTFSYNFTPADHGVHTFTFVFNTGSATGTAQTVTAKVTSGSTTLTSQPASVTVFPANVATHLAVVALPFFSGTTEPVVVVALNAANQVVSGFTDTVSFSSTGPATVSATKGGSAITSYQFTSGDAGEHVFWVTLGTTSSQTLTITDTTNTAIPAVTLKLPRGKWWDI